MLGWLLTAVVAVGVMLRGLEPSGTFLIGLTGLAPLLLFPVAGVVMSAWIVRTHSMRFAAVGAVVIYLFTFFNPSAVVGCGPEPEAPDDVVIFSQNVEQYVGQPSLLAADLATADADVIVLQEVRPDYLAALDAEPILAAYPHRADREAPSVSSGLAIRSRLPLREVSDNTLGGRPILRATVDAPTGSFALNVVHTTAPIGDHAIAQWTTQLTELADYDRSTPTVIAGDFNATLDHKPFRALVESGWTDVHDEKGCGFDATWPADRPLTLLRLDHVLLTDHFEVRDLRIGDGNGGDHRSLRATIALYSPHG